MRDRALYMIVNQLAASPYSAATQIANRINTVKYSDIISTKVQSTNYLLSKIKAVKQIGTSSYPVTMASSNNDWCTIESDPGE